MDGRRSIIGSLGNTYGPSDIDRKEVAVTPVTPLNWGLPERPPRLRVRAETRFRSVFPVRRGAPVALQGRGSLISCKI